MTLSLKIIGQRDPLLSEVITLGEKNSKTLGMFPQGAFFDHAKKKTILAAVDDEDILAGYVLFRITQRKRLVCIAHLCIDPEYRNKGVAKFLLTSVKERYKDILRGIALTCREDYIEASKLWRKFGFKPVDRHRSRSKDERYLIKWIYDFGNPDLFSDTEKQSSKVRALLDCSVIIPMCDEFSAAQIEAQSLLADWLQEEAEFLYAQEIFNELNRDEDKTRASKTRAFLRKFKAAQFKPDERDEIFTSLKAIIPGTSTNDTSDRQQLAECISAGIKYFITLDQEILDKSNDLFALYSLHVLSPTDFILLVDELSNTLDYHALRLAGANYHSGKLRSNEIEKLIKAFAGQNPNEKQHEIKSKLTKCASNTETGLVKIIRAKDGNEIAFYSLVINENIEIQLVRIINSKIAPVLFQQIVKDLVDLANKRKISVIQLQEKRLSTWQKSILTAMGFHFIDGNWSKVSIPGLYAVDQLLMKELVKKSFDTRYISDQLNRSEGPLKERLKLELERKLWPVKIADLRIPVYIIPIKPLWAGQLFDYYIANTNLFGANEELVWNRENVYYRSVKPVSERAPGRILWYLSSDSKSVTGRKNGIVACSYLDEVYVNRVKAVFEKFKRYGVYEWKDVYRLAKREILSDIKALRFSDTEVFRKIVPLPVVKKIMLQNNRRANSFASPVEVSTEIFNEIYKLAIDE